MLPPNTLKNTWQVFTHISCPPNLGNFWDCLAKRRTKAKWKRNLKSRLQNTPPHSSLNSPTHKHTLSLTDTISLSHSPSLSQCESKCYSARSSELQKRKPLSSQAPLLFFHSEVNCSFISPKTIYKSSEQTKKLYAETIIELQKNSILLDRSIDTIFVCFLLLWREFCGESVSCWDSIVRKKAEEEDTDL